MKLVAAYGWLVVVIAWPTVATAHSGGTDAKGGHFNRRTGEYHFHHGMGPHQHPGGVCPYSARTNAAASSHTADGRDDRIDRRDSEDSRASTLLWSVVAAGALGWCGSSLYRRMCHVSNE
jgi:hypothetical protein